MKHAKKEQEEVYVIYVQSDMTEGRGYMKLASDLGAFTNEQDAWDKINDYPGIMGRHPKLNNTYPVDKVDGVTTWQEYAYKSGYEGDYTVRSLRLNTG